MTLASLLALAASSPAQTVPERKAAPLQSALGAPQQAVFFRGSIWVLSCWRACDRARSFGGLVQLSTPGGKVLRRIPMGTPGALASADGALWVADFWTGRVDRIDPGSGRVVASVWLKLPRPFAPGDSAFLPSSMSAGGGSVWVSTARGRLAQIDARSGLLTRTIGAPAYATGELAADSRGVWVAEDVLGLGHVGRDGGQLHIHSFAAPYRHRVTANALAVGGGLVWILGGYAMRTLAGGPNSWVSTSAATVTAVEQRTGSVRYQLRLRGAPYQALYADGALLVADLRSGRMLRIDRHFSIRSILIGHGLDALLLVRRGVIWATSARGGLRRVAIPGV
ncbi:MAG: hypothetical protein M3025_02765 [Actinomycetota bacterium]|nr:hypothetical protein [Actinomycetota bacterium]